MARLSLLVIITIALVFCTDAEEKLYSDKYDDLDILTLVKDEKRRIEYYNCFMDNGPCSEGMIFFKEIFGEALQTLCKKCTERQKIILRQSVDWYTKNKPVEWQKMVEKYTKSYYEDLIKRTQK